MTEWIINMLVLLLHLNGSRILELDDESSTKKPRCDVTAPFSEWELCAHRREPQDMRSDDSTYDSGFRRCNHIDFVPMFS